MISTKQNLYFNTSSYEVTYDVIFYGAPITTKSAELLKFGQQSEHQPKHKNSALDANMRANLKSLTFLS